MYRGPYPNAMSIRHFLPQGYRSPAVRYNRGIVARELAIMYPKSNEKPIVILVMDDNARNLVDPQAVVLRPNAKFSLGVVCIPGGKMHDAIAEITANPRCKHPVSIVVLAMGANDVPDGAKHMGWIPARISDLMKAAKNIYPEAQISVSQILRRHDLYSTLVEEANAIISAIARNVDVPFLRPNVAPEPMLWSDLVHLSDAGLAQWLEYLDILVVVILDALQQQRQYQPQTALPLPQPPNGIQHKCTSGISQQRSLPPAMQDGATSAQVASLPGEENQMMFTPSHRIPLCSPAERYQHFTPMGHPAPFYAVNQRPVNPNGFVRHEVPHSGVMDPRSPAYFDSRRGYYPPLTHSHDSDPLEWVSNPSPAEQTPPTPSTPDEFAVFNDTLVTVPNGRHHSGGVSSQSSSGDFGSGASRLSQDFYDSEFGVMPTNSYEDSASS